MFTKNTIALAILLSVTAGAFAGTKEQQSSTPPERVYINNPPPTWQNPDLPMKK
jgi:hypothetical protein